MSTPSEYKNEYVASGIGDETLPQSLLLKSTFWTVFINSYKIYLKDYSGLIFRIPIDDARQFCLTQAHTITGSFSTTRFLLWVVKYDGTLDLYEIEPFPSTYPIIHNSRTGITSDCQYVDVDLKENDKIRAFVVKEILSVKYLYCYLFTNAFTDTPTETSLTWSSTRPDVIASNINSTNTKLTLNYLQPSSPPLVYTLDLSVPVPTNLTGTRIGYTLQIQMDWDTMSGVDQYVLERATDSMFSDATEIYTGVDSEYLDTLPVGGVYYYRVKSQVTGLFLESEWSDTFSIDVSAAIIIADFIGIPRVGVTPLTVNFTDLTIHTVAIDTYTWDFGDGDTSSLQNPTHIYGNPGIYTVYLEASGGSISDRETKIDYITVYGVDFVGVPRQGICPLTVEFSNLSVGPYTNVEWSFGDSTTSTQNNPTHVYDQAGVYDVSLRVKIGAYVYVMTKVDYIRVFNNGLTLIFD